MTGMGLFGLAAAALAIAIVTRRWRARAPRWVVRGVVRAVPLHLGRISTVSVARDWSETPQRGVYVHGVAEGGEGGYAVERIEPIDEAGIRAVLEGLRGETGACEIGEACRLEFDLPAQTLHLRIPATGPHWTGVTMGLDAETLDVLRAAFVELHEVDPAGVVYPRAEDDEDDWPERR